ncbi:hemolysin-type calcium-binding repeat 2 copies family protein [Asticcacaulis biprosthecium C19]|uniref:Hemolysin-type calcium-binding repeat 2 copies family protein n=1 Tax=Asticcacaulis biprosthecium C19 TaxID=715226 RepID=F4QGJ7_9CAUL|nr:calcium-binding protein [Asticcacaulis biprosthecium]EGF93678.1 hemolysin-type calcium-binding repeat 2 copies family protein [Asticcacaulis biprosthecium C19]
MTDLTTVFAVPVGSFRFHYDAARNVFYFADGGMLKSYNPLTQTTTTLVTLSGKIGDFGLTADGSQILIAMADIVRLADDSQSYSILYRIDMATVSEPGTYDVVHFQASYVSSAAYDLAILADNQVVMSVGTVNNYIDVVFPADTNSFISYDGNQQLGGSHLIRSENGRYVMAQESISSGGEFQLYDSQTDQIIARSGAFTYNRGRGDISEAAGLLFMFTWRGHTILDLNLEVVHVIETDAWTLDGKFNAGGHQLFLWDGATGQIEVYDTRSWTQIGSAQAMTTGLTSYEESLPEGGRYPVGMMEVSADGRFLFLQTRTGYEVVDLASRLTTSQSGTAGDDAQFGTAGQDTIQGLGGNDTLNGLGNSDSLDGGDGNDSLSGGEIGDTLNGGAGDDTISGGWNSLLNGGAGDDRLESTLGADTIDGGDGVDLFYLDMTTGASGMLFDMSQAGTAAGTTLSNGVSVRNVEKVLVWGASQNDTFVGSSGGDTFFGGAGNDSYTGGAGTNSFSGGEGNDWGNAGTGTSAQMGGGGGNDTLTGGAGADTVAGGNDNDLLSGADGADTLQGGDGTDTVTGGAGNDVVWGDSGNDLLVGGVGNDTIVGSVGNDTASYADAASGVSVDLSLFDTQNTLGAGEDRLSSVENLIGSFTTDALTGDDGANQLNGEGGNDYLVGRDGRDTLYGGAGGDDLRAGAGDDMVFGDDGEDLIFGQDGEDVLSGGADADRLLGGAGNDLLNGNEGGDILTGGSGNDTLVTSDGDDTLEGGDDNDLLTDTIGRGYMSGETGNDTLVAGDANDVLSGGFGNDSLDAGGGNDTLYGGDQINDDGVDTVLGGAGNDEIHTHGGDAIDGGEGSDILYVHGFESTAAISINAGAGGNVAGIEAISFQGGGFADTLIGSEGGDTFVGGDRADTALGGAGADILHGEAGDDGMDGGGDNDILSGGDGKDNLSGGAGDDTLAGGAGDDIYWVDAIGDVVIEAAGQGDDIVNTTVSLILADGVERLRLGGTIISTPRVIPATTIWVVTPETTSWTVAPAVIP